MRRRWRNWSATSPTSARAIAEGGPAKARERHQSRGKLLARERVNQLLDPGSPFLELAPLAAFGMYEDQIHAAGLDHRGRPGRWAASA